MRVRPSKFVEAAAAIAFAMVSRFAGVLSGHASSAVTFVTVPAKLLALIVALSSLAAAPQAPAPKPAPPEIRLVLLIAVDQFRYDYLTRFRGEFTSGFKRLLSEGAVFTDANLEHYPTVTAIGPTGQAQSAPATFTR